MDKLLGTKITLKSKWINLCDNMLTEGLQNSPIRVSLHREVSPRLWRAVQNQLQNIFVIEEALENEETLVYE